MAAKKTHFLSYCLYYRLTSPQEYMRKLFTHFINILSVIHTLIGHLESENLHCAFLNTILVLPTGKKNISFLPCLKTHVAGPLLWLSSAFAQSVAMSLYQL